MYCESDSLLQGRVVQVGREVRGFQGCQAHHLFLEVQDFPKEKKPNQYNIHIHITIKCN